MKTRVLMAASAAACVLAAGCGSVREPAGITTAKTIAHNRPTVAGNRKLAQAEGRHLLALTPVPAGAVRLSTAPRSLSGPAMGTPGVSSLVDASRSWRITMPFLAAERWLATHQPRGLRQDGSSGAAASLPPQPPGLPPERFPAMAGYGYAGPSNPAWQSAELDVEVAPDGPHDSFLRADGLVVWLDPVPVRDTAVGKRLRIAVGQGCPQTDQGVVGVTNRRGHLIDELVPPVQPLFGLVCRYYGMNGRPFMLVSQQRLTAAQARRVAALLARTPLSHPIGGIMSCPMDDESAELIVLAYPRQPDLDLWVWLNGCGGVTNGYIGVSGDPLSALPGG